MAPRHDTVRVARKSRRGEGCSCAQTLLEGVPQAYWWATVRTGWTRWPDPEGCPPPSLPGCCLFWTLHPLVESALAALFSQCGIILFMDWYGAREDRRKHTPCETVSW